jgi:hypothetical protein
MFELDSKEDVPIEDKKPSPKLFALVEEWTENYIKSTELPVKILKLAEREGISKDDIRKVIEEALIKRGLSERRIREVLPEELKYSSKVRLKPKQIAALSAAKVKPTIKYLENTIKNLEDTIKSKDKELELKIEPNQDQEVPKPGELEEINKVNFPEPSQDPTRIHSWKINIEKLDLAMDSVAREFPKLKNRGWKLVKITIEAL